jgi:hypothetical protein
VNLGDEKDVVMITCMNALGCQSRWAGVTVEKIPDMDEGKRPVSSTSYRQLSTTYRTEVCTP